MISAPETIFAAMANDRRRVLSHWRALIYLRRASNMYGPEQRRWNRIPLSTNDMTQLLRRMQRTGQIESLDRAPGCYAVMDPYAQLLPVREQELPFELNPYSVITHYTALVHHGFTLDQPKVLTAWSGGRGSLIPLGTADTEWQGLDLPLAYWPERVRAQRVRWYRRGYDTSFGIEEDYEGPIPIRVSDRERTLIDALQSPKYSGGTVNALRAWVLGSDFIDLDKVVDYTERYSVQIIRQRVGYVAESVGFHHPRFDTWASQSVRGGSSKLVGSEPYSSNFSERWNISLNAPIGELMES